MDIEYGKFIWNRVKEHQNILKHNVDFKTAAQAFDDSHKEIIFDEKHSIDEDRYFCIGFVDGRLLTVRFMYRGSMIRIFGAGYWRKGDKYYEKE